MTHATGNPGPDPQPATRVEHVYALATHTHGTRRDPRVGWLLAAVMVLGLAVAGGALYLKWRADVAAGRQQQADQRQVAAEARAEQQRRALCVALVRARPVTEEIRQLLAAFACNSPTPTPAPTSSGGRPTAAPPTTAGGRRPSGGVAAAPGAGPAQTNPGAPVARPPPATAPRGSSPPPATPTTPPPATTTAAPPSTSASGTAPPLLCAHLPLLPEICIP